MNLPKPKNYLELFLDMDSFFASVEQQVQPPLREVPVGIAPYTGSTGCIIAASKNAKNQGIKVGTSVAEARRINPQVKILESRPFLYHLYHKEIVRVLSDFTPFLRILSIDEMMLPLDQFEQNQEEATKIAFKIKQKIRQEVGDFLTCSIGVGPNHFLAKVAAEAKKPDGLNFVRLDELADFYGELELLDLPGINLRMQQALNLIGVRSPLDFYQTKDDFLARFFHWPGRLWYYRLRGYEVDDYQSRTATIGHSFVLPPQFRSQLGARKVIVKLATKVGYRLRQQNFQARSLSLFIRFLNGRSDRQFVNFSPISDSQTIIRHALNLFEKIDFSESAPINIFLVAFKLAQTDRQRSLFAEIQKISNLSQAMDEINDEFGPDSIYFAETDHDQSIAPNRIPFGRPRYEMS